MNAEIDALEKQIYDLKAQLSAARRKLVPEPVRDYDLTRADGTRVRLSELFGDRREMLLVHNMGRKCVYCTLWADGLQALTDHLQSRVALAIATPDEPAVAREFAAGRGWRWPMVSTRGTTMTRDLGYEPEPGKHWPGVSALRKTDGGAIERTGRTMFGPGDDLCALWPLFDLLDGGAGNWRPRFEYA